MAYYLVRAKPDWDQLNNLSTRLKRGEIKEMQPFGKALHHSLTNARQAGEEEAIWEEEDYCRPPLAMEREAVLDQYFGSIEVEEVESGEGWERIEGLPSMWDSEKLS